MKILIKDEMSFGGNKYSEGDIIDVAEVTARMLIERGKCISVRHKLEVKLEEKVEEVIEVEEDSKLKPVPSKKKSFVSKVKKAFKGKRK